MGHGGSVWTLEVRQTLTGVSLSSQEPRPDALQGSPCIRLTFRPQCSLCKMGPVGGHKDRPE